MRNLNLLALFCLAGSSLLAQTAQSFTVSGSFVIPSGANSITVEVVGAGGSGGINGSGGGGGGGYAMGVYTVTPGTSYAVTIGAGGAGSSGGTTSFGSLISASGGANGNSVSNPNIGGGGAGGVGSNGTIANRTGGAGGGGYYTYFGGGGGGAAGSTANGTNGGNTITWTGVCQTPGGTAGTGGGAPGGNGGKGAGFTDVNCSVSDPSGNGLNYGGGGGGGNGSGGGPGTGANGYCIVSWGNCVPPPTPLNTTSPANLSVCGSGSATLSASGTGTLNWYASPGAVTPVGTGTSYITPVLTGNTTLYVEDQTCAASLARTAIVVTVSPLPVVSVSASSPTVCMGGQVQLNASGANTYSWSVFVPSEMTFSTGATNSVTPQATTNYTVTGSLTTTGCQNSAIITVSVKPLPVVNVISTNSVICAGNSASLIANGALSYSWTPAGSGSVVVVSPAATTTYSVVGTDANGCSSMAVVTQSVTICTGISATETDQKFVVFPNPNQGECIIRAATAVDITIINEMGQTIKTASLNKINGYTFSLKHLSPGIYFIKEENSRLAPQKIVVRE